MHHPEQRFVYYGFSQVQPTKVFVEGTFISHTLSLCFLLSFMASRAKISSDPAILLEYIEGLSCDSESDNDFDGYLGPEDGPVACATVPEVIEREGLCSPVRRSLSTDDLTAAEVSELPESPFTSSVSPMQGQHSSRSPLSPTSETNSSHFTIFNSATKLTPQVFKIHYDIHASNVITQNCRCLHESRESWSRGTNAFKVVL